MATKPAPPSLNIAWPNAEYEVIEPFAHAVIAAHRAEHPADAADDSTVLRRFVSTAIIDAALQEQAKAADDLWREQETSRRLEAEQQEREARAVLAPAPETDTETA